MAQNRSRNNLRTILVFIILGTIPCYLLGITVWLFSGDGDDNGALDSTPTERPSVQPALPTIDGNTLPTLDIGDVTLSTETNTGGIPTNTATSTPFVFVLPTIDGNPTQNIPATVTNTPNFGITPSPTFSIVITPSATFVVLPTITPQIQSTPTATHTQQILLPPTDTPNP